MRLLLLFALLLALAGGGIATAAERLPIDFSWPAFSGDFYVTGSVSFPPGAVKGARNIQVRAGEPPEETPVKVTIGDTWPDGSALSADITFAANRERRSDYSLHYGDDVTGKKTFRETAVLPHVSFSTGGAPRAAENVDMSVGQLNVTIDRSPDIYYYWHILPIVAIVVVTYLRGRRAGRALQ